MATRNCFTCVLPFVAALSVVACDRSNEPPPPRPVVSDALIDIAASDDTTSGREDQDDYVDDYLAPPYESYDAAGGDDLAWDDGEPDEEYEDFFGAPEDTDADTDDDWCADDDLLCDYRK